VWISLETNDEAAFQQLLANSALQLDSLRNGGKEPRETPASIKFQTRAARSVQDKLGIKNAIVTDGMIIAVSGLITYSVGRKKISERLFLKLNRHLSATLTAGLYTRRDYSQ
jgi:hypothetical protein